MDKNVQYVVEKRVERTMKNLEKNNMKAYFVPTKEAALNKVKELLTEGTTIGVGGSMTLFEIGAIELLRNGKYQFLDRHQEGLTPEQMREISLKNFSADTFLMSSNAITEQGELYNVDGKGTRVAPLLYGPNKVIVVAGVNKIVKDVDAAILRNEDWAAPINAKRLNRKTPCSETGYCMDCNSPERICNEYVLIKRQLDPERIHVILVNQELGY